MPNKTSNAELKGSIGDYLYRLYANPDSRLIGGELSKKDMGVAGNLTPESQNMYGYSGAHSVGAERVNGKVTPYYKYSGDNYSVGADPRNVNAHVNMPIGKSGQLGLGAYLGKDNNSINATYKHLLKNGFIDVSGNLTKEGYNFMVNGQVDF